MQYIVNINENTKTVTVTLPDGSKGVAKCCPTDKFDIGTGIELALERAKVAKAGATPDLSKCSVMELVKALEKALPKGEMVVVGNGVEMTDRQKKWLHSLTDCKGEVVKSCCPRCSCDEDNDEEMYSVEEYDEGCDEAYERGKSEGYDEGYDEGYGEGENDNAVDTDEIAEKVREILAEVLE